MAVKPKKVSDADGNPAADSVTPDAESVTPADEKAEEHQGPDTRSVTPAPESVTPVQEIHEPPPAPSPAPEPEPEPEQLADVHRFPAHLGKLRLGRLKGMSHVWRMMAADIPANTPPEALLDPGYWAHYARDLQPKDIIWALCEDGRWEGQFRVMFVGSAEARLSPVFICRHEDGGARIESDLYEVAWAGPVLRYVVRRRDNHAVIRDRLFPESAAYDYLRRHLAEMKR